MHLGFRLSKFVSKQIFLARGAAGGNIEQFDLTLPAQEAAVFGDAKLPQVSASMFATGLVALYADTGARSTPTEAITGFLQGTGLGGPQLIEARTEKPVVITAHSATKAALELTQLLSQLPSRFPKRDGLALFVAGPTLLAFLIGRALNPSVVGRVLLTNYGQETYRLTYGLPFEPRTVEIDLSYDSRYADLLFEVITRRYEAPKPVVLTTNKPFSEWPDVFPHAACVVTLVDRLIHRCEVLQHRGPELPRQGGQGTRRGEKGAQAQRDAPRFTPC